MAIGGGIGGIVLLVIVMLLGGDPKDLVNMASPTAQQAPDGEYVGTPAEEKLKQFVSVVLADTEEIWGEIFRANGEQYRQPSLVLFTGAVQSACGTASSASGPFYCPPDQDVYLDLSFFDEMRTRLGASGDFAAAYVIAHEVGHHVQNQMGLTEKVHNMRGRASEEEYNQMSVRLELQADYLAGVWAHHAQETLGVLEPGDIEEALAAASAIGDDRLQKQSQGYVVPDAFTHGTSAQRVKWFRLGYDTGDLSRGDTFATDYEDL
jgi:hypothetical protein